MINEVCARVRTQLRSRKFLTPVHYGPERLVRDSFRGGVVFERDRQAGDLIGPPQGWRRPPGDAAHTPLQCRHRGRVMVYAQSSRPGADVEAHEVECERIRDGVLCALYTVCNGHELQIEGARWTRAAEWGDLEGWPGAAYEIRFSAASRVADVDYTGAGPDTAEIAAVVLDAVESPGLPDYDPTH